MSTLIDGDIAEGTAYWGTVSAMKAELERIYAKTNPYMQTWKQLSPDVKVHIRLLQGKAHAVIYVGLSDLWIITTSLSVSIYNFDTTKNRRNYSTISPFVSHSNTLVIANNLLILDNDETTFRVVNIETQDVLFFFPKTFHIGSMQSRSAIAYTRTKIIVMEYNGVGNLFGNILIHLFSYAGVPLDTLVFSLAGLTSSIVGIDATDNKILLYGYDLTGSTYNVWCFDYEATLLWEHVTTEASFFPLPLAVISEHFSVCSEQIGLSGNFQTNILDNGTGDIIYSIFPPAERPHDLGSISYAVSGNNLYILTINSFSFPELPNVWVRRYTFTLPTGNDPIQFTFKAILDLPNPDLVSSGIWISKKG
jgi:hypothetical protein